MPGLRADDHHLPVAGAHLERHHAHVIRDPRDANAVVGLLGNRRRDVRAMPVHVEHRAAARREHKVLGARETRRAEIRTRGEGDREVLKARSRPQRERQRLRGGGHPRVDHGDRHRARAAGVDVPCAVDAGRRKVPLEEAVPADRSRPPPDAPRSMESRHRSRARAARGARCSRERRIRPRAGSRAGRRESARWAARRRAAPRRRESSGARSPTAGCAAP